MAKIYNGTVSVVKNTKGVITVKADAEGKFSMLNVKELYKTVVELGKKHKAPVKLFNPDNKGVVPILFADHWGNPYLALLPEQADGAGRTSRPAVTKLA